jgi:anti-anti-sigma factor
MALPSGHGELQIESVGGVTVVKFLHRHILAEEAVEALGRQFRRLGERPGRRNLVLNFGNVERLSSAVLGQVVALDGAVRRVGGRLALCAVRPDVYQALQLLGLSRYLHCYANEEDALESLRLPPVGDGQLTGTDPRVP